MVVNQFCISFSEEYCSLLHCWRWQKGIKHKELDLSGLKKCIVGTKRFINYWSGWWDLAGEAWLHENAYIHWTPDLTLPFFSLCFFVWMSRLCHFWSIHYLRARKCYGHGSLTCITQFNGIFRFEYLTGFPGQLMYLFSYPKFSLIILKQALA